MYWRNALLMLVLVFFTACVNSPQKQNKFDFNTTLKEERQSDDYLILQSLFAFHYGDANGALDGFDQLYKKTKNKTYLKKAIEIAFVTKNDRLSDYIKSSQKILSDDEDIMRINIGYYLMNGQIAPAKKISQKLLNYDSNNSSNHNIIGTIYVIENDLNAALKEFEKAYDLEQNEDNLLKMVDVLSKLGRNDDAKNYLINWNEENGCTQSVCLSLINLYSKEENFTKIVELYIDLYKIYSETIYLQSALGVFIYKKDYYGAKQLLEEYGFNNKALMDLYATLGEKDKAYDMAFKLYKSTQNNSYKSLMAIYKYEMYEKNISKTNLDEVLVLFEESVYKNNDPIFYNYYGYLLIDHNINVKKGIELTKKAHELDPDSSYIIDSVAWGYYKLGRCKEAKQWMDKVKDDVEFMSSTEAKEHKTAIDTCTKK